MSLDVMDLCIGRKYVDGWFQDDNVFIGLTFFCVQG